MSYPLGDPALDGRRGQPAARAVSKADSDEAVLAQSLARPELFGELYSRHFAGLYRYVAGRLGPDVADDLAAETFLAAFRRRRVFDPSLGTVRPWLYGIATNLIARHHRAESRRYAALARVSAVPVAHSEEERIAERLSAGQARRPLAGALARLPKGDRDVLLLVALGGLSYAEVAFALSVPEGTVGSRLNRARRKLAAAFGGTNPAAAAPETPPASAGRD